MSNDVTPYRSRSKKKVQLSCAYSTKISCDARKCWKDSYLKLVVTALSQLTSLLTTPRICANTYSATSSAKRSNLKGKCLSERRTNSKQEESYNVTKEIFYLDHLPEDLSVQQLCPLFSHHDNSHNRWKNRNESFVSANTFFENKTGFPESQLNTGNKKYSTRIVLLNKDVHRLLNTAVHHLFFQQNRGFKTKRAQTGLGIGTLKRKEDEPKRSKEGDEKPAEKKFHSDYYKGFHDAKKENKQSRMTEILKWTPLVVLVYFVWRMAVGISAGLGGMVNHKFEVNPEDVNVTFKDVRGVDEAKQELQDVVQFLKDPNKFTSLGAKLPKGVLLVGPPGTGKTLLARAVAGEAGVPFFHASGSEFDEVFVGSGAKRVRNLFQAAKIKAPCVIFLDEIDSVGAKRTKSSIHPYANQTINQLLAEMDGFSQNEGVIVLGATNRRQNLDKAILRPGRFDVEVRVFPPDMKGRKDILKLYLSKVKTSAGINIEEIARGTTGFTGADLENLVNQAALKAAMDGDEHVTLKHIDFAKDKVMMGPAKKGRLTDEKTNWNTAYHEAGHTIVAYFTKDADPVHKVTIIPRGQALGFTASLPEQDSYNITKSQILAKMDICMGGRLGEELVYGGDKVTTGAANDFQQATELATRMVRLFGMSDKLGVRVYGNDISPALQESLDNEIKRILQESCDRAKQILKDHTKEHRELAKALMKYETLDKDDIKCIMTGKTLKKTLNENGQKQQN